MTANETRAMKAKNLRYKKPIVRDLNYQKILDELYEMQEACDCVRYFESDEENLDNALDGDEDEAYEFKIAFADLETELERFAEDLQEAFVGEYFDTFFPAAGADYAGGFLGWDTYEGDYFGLEPYQYAWAQDEAAQKLMRLTKKELLEAAGICLKVAHQYMAIRYRYDCLDAAIETLRGINMDRIKAVKGVEEWYERAEESSCHFQFKYGKEINELEKYLREIPREYWVA